MREALRALEGQKVHYKGRLKEWKSNGDGTVRICMAAVEIRPMDKSRALKSIRPIKVDHFWQLDVPETDIETRTLLNLMTGIGTVRWYRRADQSVDLGVVGETSISIEHLLTAIQNIDTCTPQGLMEAISLLQAVLQSIDSGTSCHAWSVPTTKAVEKMRQRLVDLERDCSAELKARVGAANQGHKPIGLDLLPLRNCRRKQPKAPPVDTPVFWRYK